MEFLLFLARSIAYLRRCVVSTQPSLVFAEALDEPELVALLQAAIA